MAAPRIQMQQVISLLQAQGIPLQGGIISEIAATRDMTRVFLKINIDYLSRNPQAPDTLALQNMVQTDLFDGDIVLTAQNIAALQRAQHHAMVRQQAGIVQQQNVDPRQPVRAPQQPVVASRQHSILEQRIRQLQQHVTTPQQQVAAVRRDIGVQPQPGAAVRQQGTNSPPNSRVANNPQGHFVPAPTLLPAVKEVKSFCHENDFTVIVHGQTLKVMADDQIHFESLKESLLKNGVQFLENPENKEILITHYSSDINESKLQATYDVVAARQLLGVSENYTREDVTQAHHQAGLRIMENGRTGKGNIMKMEEIKEARNLLLRQLDAPEASAQASSSSSPTRS